MCPLGPLLHILRTKNDYMWQNAEFHCSVEFAESNWLPSPPPYSCSLLIWCQNLLFTFNMFTSLNLSPFSIQPSTSILSFNLITYVLALSWETPRFDGSFRLKKWRQTPRVCVSETSFGTAFLMAIHSFVMKRRLGREWYPVFRRH